MEVTEYDRHQLFVWFEERMGPERAATMMNLIPPIGWFELASKHDLAELEGRIDGKLARLESSLKGSVHHLAPRQPSHRRHRHGRPPPGPPLRRPSSRGVTAVIELETEGDVRILRMREGENRFNRPFVDAVHAALDEVAAVEGPVALVAVGEGKFFSNGLDLDWLTHRRRRRRRLHRRRAPDAAARPRPRHGHGGRHQRPRLRRRRHARHRLRLPHHARGPRATGASPRSTSACRSPPRCTPCSPPTSPARRWPTPPSPAAATPGPRPSRRGSSPTWPPRPRCWSGRWRWPPRSPARTAP